MSRLKVRTKRISQTLCVLSIAGELDARSVQKLEEPLAEMIHEGVTRIIVDLADVERPDSEAVALLVRIARELLDDGALSVVCSGHDTRRALEDLGADQVFVLDVSGSPVGEAQ